MTALLHAQEQVKLSNPTESNQLKSCWISVCVQRYLFNHQCTFILHSMYIITNKADDAVLEFAYQGPLLEFSGNKTSFVITGNVNFKIIKINWGMLILLFCLKKLLFNKPFTIRANKKFSFLYWEDVLEIVLEDDNCAIKGGKGGDDPGKPCVYPFTYKKITYMEFLHQIGMKPILHIFHLKWTKEHCNYNERISHLVLHDSAKNMILFKYTYN